MTRITVAITVCFGLVAAISLAVAQDASRGAGDDVHVADARRGQAGEAGAGAVQVETDEARLTADEIRLQLEDSKNLYAPDHPLIVRLEKLLKGVEQLEIERAEALARAKQQAQTAARLMRSQKARTTDGPQQDVVQIVEEEARGAGAHFDMGHLANDAFWFSVGFLRGDGSPDIERLRNEYQRLENQAAGVAVQLRAQLHSRKWSDDLEQMYQVTPPGFTPLGSRKSENETKRLQDLLKKLVGGAFDARQRIHQAEIAAGREQLHRIEQSIQSNERSREELIEQRVKELLDPRSSDLNLKLDWESDVWIEPGEILASAEDTTWRLTIRGAEAKDVPKVLEALTEVNPTISFSMIEGNTNTIVARGTLDNLKSLRKSLLTLVQSEAAKDLPRGLAIEVNGPVFSGEMPPTRTTNNTSTDGSKSDFAEMILRMSWRDPVSSTRLSIRGPQAQELLKVIQKANPSITYSLDDEMIVARGFLNDLKLLRQRLQALGQWEAAEDLPPGFMVEVLGLKSAPATTPKELDVQIRIVPLEHGQASNIAIILARLFPDVSAIVEDERTNSLILRANDEQLKQILELIENLEELAKRQGSVNEPGTSIRDNALHSIPLKNASAKEVAPFLAKLLAPHVTVETNERTNSLLLFGTAESLDAAKKLIELSDRKAENPPGISGENSSISELYDEYLDSKGRSQSNKQGRDPADSGKTDALRKILETIIQEEFEKRQALLREELESLRQRLDAIEKKIASREAAVNEIVERRVEELLSRKQSAAPDDSGRSDAVDKASRELAGVWRLSGETSNGKKRDTGVTGTLTFRGNQVRSNLKNPGGDDVNEGVFRYFSVNPEKSPAEINLYGTNFVVEGIYNLAGDELTFAVYGRPEIGRPRSFAVEDVPPEGLSLVVMTFRKLDQASEGSGVDGTREPQVDPGSKAEQREAFVARFPDTVTEDVQTQEPNPETSLQQFVDISPDERFAATVQNAEDGKSYVLTLWKHDSGRPIRKTERPGTAATVRFAESGSIVGVHKVFETAIDLYHVRAAGCFMKALAYPSAQPWQAALNEYAIESPVSLGVGMHGAPGEVKIMSVKPGTGAEKAGLREGDQILALDGHAVSEIQAVVDRTMWRNPGEEVTLLILRGDERLTVKVRLTDFQSFKEE